ncbi:MAG: hypothetical protein QNJ27_02270, partial [Simkaniaceae bacterium]|nr:hypothetical protein [Simkaniaceae bacterium]
DIQDKSRQEYYQLSKSLTDKSRQDYEALSESLKKLKEQNAQELSELKDAKRKLRQQDRTFKRAAEDLKSIIDTYLNNGEFTALYGEKNLRLTHLIEILKEQVPIIIPTE